VGQDTRRSAATIPPRRIERAPYFRRKSVRHLFVEFPHLAPNQNFDSLPKQTVLIAYAMHCPSAFYAHFSLALQEQSG
jgi:hypothetical protein